MAQFITLPQYRNPWVQNLPTMLQNMALQKVGQKFRASEAEESRKFELEQTQENREYSANILKSQQLYTQQQKLKEQDFKLQKDPNIKQVDGPRVGAFMHNGKFYVKNKPPAGAIGRYNFAMSQHLAGKGPNPGSFVDYEKNLAKAKASNINIGGKIELEEQKSNLKIKQAVKQPKMRNDVVNFLRSQDEDWDMKDIYVKEEAIFKEMNRQVQVAYEGKAVFDEGRNPPGWYVGNKLIRQWKDPLKHRSDNIR